MSAPLVTQRELEGLLRRLAQLEQRVARVEVIERLNYTLPTAYTPTYLGGTTAGVTTYTTQTGAYVRIGNVVIVRLGVVWTAATGTGNAQVSLPFTSAAFAQTGSLYLTNVTFAAGTPEMLIGGSAAFFTMGSPASNAGPTIVAVEAAGNIVATVAYIIA